MAFAPGPMPGEPRAETYRVVDGVRLRYRLSGHGPAVVLLHGYASSLEVWDDVVPLVAAQHTVLSVDLKGFGWSERPAGDYGPAAQAALVLELLDELGLGEVAVVGHSWGASVALALALAAPERVRSIALYDAWVFEAQLPSFFVWSRAAFIGELLFGLYYEEGVEPRLAQGFFDPAAVTPELVQAAARAFERPGTVAAALATARGQRFAEVEGRYREIRQPVLLLWGENDRVSPLPVAQRLLVELPNARLVTFPRCGHLPMLEATAASTRVLVDFLGSGA